MDCRVTPAINFKTRIGFKQHDSIMLQEQSNVLSYYIDAYFPKYKLAIEVDQQGHNSRDIDYEIEKQKEIEKELGCEFIRIDPAKENLIVLLR